MDSKFADLYEETCNFSFDVYSKNIEPMVNYVREKYPIEKARGCNKKYTEYKK